MTASFTAPALAAWLEDHGATTALTDAGDGDVVLTIDYGDRHAAASFTARNGGRLSLGVARPRASNRGEDLEPFNTLPGLLSALRMPAPARDLAST